MPSELAPYYVPVRSEQVVTGNSIAATLRASGLPDLEARVLLGHVLGVDRAWLIAHAGDELEAGPMAAYRALCDRRRQGEPIAYIVGKREFYGLDIGVTPAVLIPRPETELLVELALQNLSRNATAAAKSRRVLDLGTGSGCIALAIASSRPDASVCAADFSTAALAVARANATALGLNVQWIESDWYTSLDELRFDLIVANPPYIARGDPHLGEGDLRFEPEIALTDGSDGWTAIDAIIGGAREHLEPGGRLLFEHGYDQAQGARSRLERAGFAEVQTWRDLAGIERVSGGRT
jgi:release factor glutamine methyltransferase